MTHEKAVSMIRGKTNRTTRRIGNNTVGVIHDNGDVGIILHSTEVVTIHADGTYTIRTGGWRTVTTKDRINTYCPFRVYQHKGEWYVCYFDGNDRHTCDYSEGMRWSRDMFNQLVTV